MLNFLIVVVFSIFNYSYANITLHFYKKINKVNLIIEDKLIKTYHFSYGKKKGKKKRWGDRRTPEGEYRVLKKYTRKFMENNFIRYKDYGSVAYVLNYPNKEDLNKGYSGGGIWIHGTDYPYRLDKKNVTKGCIILYNKDIREITNFIQEYDIEDITVIIDP